MRGNLAEIDCVWFLCLARSATVCSDQRLTMPIATAATTTASTTTLFFSLAQTQPAGLSSDTASGDSKQPNHTFNANTVATTLLADIVTKRHD